MTNFRITTAFLLLLSNLAALPATGEEWETCAAIKELGTPSLDRFDYTVSIVSTSFSIFLCEDTWTRKIDEFKLSASSFLLFVIGRRWWLWIYSHNILQTWWNLTNTFESYGPVRSYYRASGFGPWSSSLLWIPLVLRKGSGRRIQGYRNWSYLHWLEPLRPPSAW